MCLPAAVLSLRLCCVATKVAGWNQGCGFAERFQQIALFNCKEFDYSERSRFRTFRLFCWTKITYLLDEINIYYMDPVTFEYDACLSSRQIGYLYFAEPRENEIIFAEPRVHNLLMDPVTFSTICLNMTRAYHLDRLDIYILLNEFYFLLNHVMDN